MFLNRYFSSVLYGVRPRDPATLAGASLVLLAAAVATAWPAYRAAKTDPVEALREAALRPAEPGSDFTRLFAWIHLTALEAGRRMAPASRANRRVRLLGRLTVQTDIRLMCKVKSLLSETIALEKGNPRPNGNPSFQVPVDRPDAQPAPVQATEFTECPHPTIAIRSRHALTSCVHVIARAWIFEAAALTVRLARSSDVSPRASGLGSQPGCKLASAKMMHGSPINVAPRRPAP
jgi:hypothetical protein